MGINYKQEVDSGYDRKNIVERTILTLLKDGFPPEILLEDSNFNIRHREMLYNLKNGYNKKLESLEDLYDTMDVELAPSYYETVHNIKELYPMTKEEEQNIFAKYDRVKNKIEECKNKDLKDLQAEREDYYNKIVELKIKYPILDSIINFSNDLDKFSSNSTISVEIMETLMKKYNISKNNYLSTEIIYNKYRKLLNMVDSLSYDISNYEKGYSSKQLLQLYDEKRKIESEILQRNLKLMNYVIRSRFKALLVEQEELYEICLESLFNAVRRFDASRGFRFSSYAYKYIYGTVIRNCQKLTGYKWEDYWNRYKIKKYLDSASEVLGYRADINDLVDMGFIDKSYLKSNSLVSVYLNSYFESDIEPDDDNISFEEYELFDESDYNIVNNVSVENYFEEELDNKMLSDTFVEVLDTLTSREKFVIVLRYGLDRDKFLESNEKKLCAGYSDQLTLEQVGKVLDITRERVRQIEMKALRKLRHPSRSKRVKGYLD